MRVFMRFSLCFVFASMLSVVLLVGLMFFARFDLIEAFIWTGTPLSALSLHLLPAEFWVGLTGLNDAPNNPAVQSFLQLCAALGQLGLLLASGLYHYWYRV